MDNLSLLVERAAQLLETKPRAVIAIDGMAASGKTTLAAALSARIPRSFVVHMDDFTLPFEMRAVDHAETALCNADVARFDREALTPFLAGRSAAYAPYVCHPVPGFLDPVAIPADTRLLIVEGAYCLHPALFERCDLRVLYTIDGQTQRARILARNGPAQLERFLTVWIPMERRHIAARGLEKTCDLVLSGA